MHRSSVNLSALLAAILAAACYVVPYGTPDPRADRGPAAIAPAAPPPLTASPCEEDEDRVTCDLDARWSPAPRGAWEACSRPA